MAFSKYASANMVRPSISYDGWYEELQKSNTVDIVRGLGQHRSRFMDRTGTKVVLEQYDPNQYLLSHATIVASVDTEAPPDVQVGKHMDHEGFEVNREYPNYYITPATTQFINANHDSFERKLLMGSFHSFVGAQNFCFLPGTMVMMADGTSKPIEMIQVGEDVVTHKGNVRKVVHKHERAYQGEVVKIYVDRKKTPIVCTPNHPFYTVNRKECACGCGTPFDSNDTNTKLHKYNRKFSKGHQGEVLSTGPFKVAAGKLSLGDLLCSPSDIKPNEESRVTYAEAKLIGYFAAEGSYARDNVIRFSFNTKEKEFIQ